MDQEKKISPHIDSQNKVDFSMIFNEEPSFVFIFKKTEKLVSAIFLVTNLFKDTESIKWTLRDKATNLLSFVIGSKNNVFLNKLEFIDNLKIKVAETVSLLEVSFAGELISKMNLSVLKDEFFNLILELDNLDYSKKNSINSLISKEYFQFKKPETTDNFNGIQRPAELKEKNVFKEKIDLKRSNRQNLILNLIRKKKELTIKDISEVITDCSEKTIQRELITFISLGILKRTGERRWSKYSLA